MLKNSERRKIIFGAALVSALPLAFAQSNKLTKIVVPFPPSGNLDSITRLVADGLQPLMGTNVVENKPGVNGNIGSDLVFKSAPDGGVLMFAPSGPLAVNKFLYPKLNFDPNLFEPVAMLGSVPNVLSVNASLPVKNLQEFIAYVKARPGQVAYASQGVGSSSHLAAELFMQITGLKMLHVPYKGTGPALVDLMGGQVAAFFDTLSSSAKYASGGKLKILAVAEKQRSQYYPEFPTFSEAAGADMSEMVSSAWYAVVAPPKTPADIVKKYNTAVNQVLAAPAVKAKFKEMGIDLKVLSVAETRDFINSEIKRWSAVIRLNKISVE